MWKSIGNLEKHFEKFEYWVIGDGRSVKAWYHKWLDWDIRISDLNLHIPNDLLHVTVAELLTDTGDWNLALLSSWLPEEIVARFVAKPPPKVDDGQDLCLWPGSNTVTFTVSSTYKLLCQIDEDISCDFWKIIWHLETKECVRHFVWLLWHNRLLTNARKAKMQLGAASCTTVEMKMKLLSMYLGTVLLLMLFGFILSNQLICRISSIVTM